MKNSIKTAEPEQIAKYLKYLYNIAISISSGRSNHPIWAALYDKIFSAEISEVIYHRFNDFHFADPDEDYYDDVKEFVSQFTDYVSTKLYDKETVIFPSFDDWEKEKEQEFLTNLAKNHVFRTDF